MVTSVHSAAGPAAGFEYQFERALKWLSEASSGTCVGIETADDVAVRDAENNSILEQDKFSIVPSSRPFGDKSKGLWNTLAIWLDGVGSGTHPLESTSFLMVTNTAIPASIARRIAEAKSKEEAEACIVELAKIGGNPPKHISMLVTKVLSPESRDVLRRLIVKVHLSDASERGSSHRIRQATITHLQLPGWSLDHADSIADELSGWLHRTVMQSWRDQQPAWVQRDHFVNQLHAALHRRERQIKRERAELLIPVTDEDVGREKGRPFVRQLHLICDDDTVVDIAIREFIRCNIEKMRLSREGNITDEDWEGFKTALVSRWQKIRTRVSRMKTGTPEEDIGFEVFSETTSEYREKLAGSDTEQVYLTSGTYHRLADLMTLGWHPKYEALMLGKRKG